MTVVMQRASQSGHIPQRRLHRRAPLGGERGLRRHGIADVVALDRQPRLDAGGEVEAGEGFVDAPELSLLRYRLVPALAPAQVVELDALPGNDAGRSRHPSISAD